MKVDILNTTKLYIAAPARSATGGPELLHQLARKLRDREINAVMFYYPEISQPVHDNYLHYDIPYTTEIIDTTDNILIVPETMTRLLDTQPKIRKIIWWLSYDNYFLVRIRNPRVRTFLLNRNLGIRASRFFGSKMAHAELHLVQSAYAKAMLATRGVKNTAYLTDYLHSSFISQKTDLQHKQDIVAYNPDKGARITKRIIKHCSNTQFVPIKNMAREEVIDLLKRAKVYIDFGSHPGRDRIPREAAILKCCVLTNTRGSAKFEEDLPIPNCYKFDDEELDLDAIRLTIEYCLSEYEDCCAQFKQYRSTISKQEKIFEKEISKLFFRR